jgi:hypothetical protein
MHPHEVLTPHVEALPDVGHGKFSLPVIFNSRNVEEMPWQGNSLAQDHGERDLVVKGQSALFFQSPMLARVGDYLWHRRMERSPFRRVRNVAQAEKLGVWRVLQ